MKFTLNIVVDKDIILPDNQSDIDYFVENKLLCNMLWEIMEDLQTAEKDGGCVCNIRNMWYELEWSIW